MGQILGGHIGWMSRVLLQTACTSPLIQTHLQSATATLDTKKQKIAKPIRIAINSVIFICACQ